MKLKTKPNDPIEFVAQSTVAHGFAMGLTKREYFASLAMQGICAGSDFYLQEIEEHSKVSVKCADALILELNKEKQE